jgi:selenocysteine lyase/cysteine desulfurase
MPKRRPEQGLTIDTVRQHVVGVDRQVPLLDGSSCTYINFDNAASTPALRPVSDTVSEFLEWYSSVHRGTGFKSQLATEMYDQAHDIVARFVGADPEANVVIFGKNTTDALNKLARRFPFGKDDVVLCSLIEHHSNDLPWRAVAQVEHVGVDGSGRLDESHMDHLLEEYSGRVKLVAITGASNVTGHINPIHRLAEKAHAAGALIMVDAAQLAPHRRIDVRPNDAPDHIDFLALSAHKMYAPFGTGALIGPREFFLHGDPDDSGGGTVDFVTVNSVRWADPPDRDEAGSPNVIGAVAMAKAALCLEDLGMDQVAAHEADLVAHTLQVLNSLDGVKIYGELNPSAVEQRVGVIPFSVDGLSHYLVASILSAEGGIGVRNGCFCAHPYLLQLMQVQEDEAARYRKEISLGIKASIPGLVRVSFGCYNTQREVDKFAEVLERVTRHQWEGRYSQDATSGEYRPEGFDPVLDEYFRLH